MADNSSKGGEEAGGAKFVPMAKLKWIGGGAVLVEVKATVSITTEMHNLKNIVSCLNLFIQNV